MSIFTTSLGTPSPRFNSLRVKGKAVQRPASCRAAGVARLASCPRCGASRSLAPRISTKHCRGAVFPVLPHYNNTLALTFSQYPNFIPPSYLTFNNLATVHENDRKIMYIKQVVGEACGRVVQAGSVETPVMTFGGVATVLRGGAAVSCQRITPTTLTACYLLI